VLIRWLLAAVHLLALGVGLGAVWSRARALRSRLDTDGIRRVLQADNLWGLAALLWIGTGVARLFGQYEKGLQYYLHNHAFHAKMGLFALLLLLELWPMVTLIRWRIALGRGETVRPTRAGTMAAISTIEAIVVVAIVFAATAMARGLGARAP
jgi:putative membrane protein